MDAEAAVRQLGLIAIDQLVGREIGADRLIQAGLDALLAGVESPSLPVLAGLTRREEPEARELFDRVTEELKVIPVGLPTDPATRAWALVRWWAQLIVDGALDVGTGGRLIWWHGWDFLNGPEVLRPLAESITVYDDEITSWAIWDTEYVTRNRAAAAAVVTQARAFLSLTRPPEA